MTYLTPQQARRAEIRGYYVIHPSTDMAIKGPIPNFEEAQQLAARLNGEKHARDHPLRRDRDLVEVRVLE